MGNESPEISFLFLHTKCLQYDKQFTTQDESVLPSHIHGSLVKRNPILGRHGALCHPWIRNDCVHRYMFFIAVYACLWNCFNFVWHSMPSFIYQSHWCWCFHYYPYVNVLPNVGINLLGCSIGKGIMLDSACTTHTHHALTHMHPHTPPPPPPPPHIHHSNDENINVG